MAKQIQTVTGPIPVDELGVTLTHEHLWHDIAPLYRRAHPDLVMQDEKVSLENRYQIMKDLHSVVFEYADNLQFHDVDLTVKELSHFKAAGGKTIVEVSCVDLERNPLKLKEIAEKSGVQVIMGGTYYWFPSLEKEMQDRILIGGKNKLADIMIREVTDGVDGTGIKPGILGEVGNGEEEGTRIIYEAVAIAQRETGLPVTCHSPDIDVLDIMEREGADLSKVVMGHWSAKDPMRKAFERGAFVSIDQFGMNFPGIEDDDSRVRAVLSVFEMGYEKQLLLSQDVCWKVRLKQFGGDGYAQIFEHIVPKLKAGGLTDEQIHMLFVDNVKRLFT